MRLRCRGLHVGFATAQGRVKVLEDVSLEASEGEFVSVVGPSGCGKTTLLRLIAGLLSPDRGAIEKKGRSRTVFQENSLFPWMTVLDNAAFGLEMDGVPRAEREQRALPMLHRFGFAGRERAYPHQLSLGMKQRVAVIRCFLSEPDLMLMDEPFAALDALTRLTLQEELLSLWERQRKSIVFVTHDIEEAIRLSDRILVMASGPGRIISEHAVPLLRPRPLAVVADAEFQEMKTTMLRELGIQTGSAVLAR